MDYEDEPDILFEPVSSNRYCDFYDLEMGNFTDDVKFYLRSLQSSRNILELGCGSGRLSRHLAANGHSVTAIDISIEMLKQASVHNKKNIHYICMDMLRFSFSTPFDTIIIPYNTLNLLTDSTQVETCFRLCREHLPKDGKLLLQLYLPGRDLKSSTTKTFQFRIFDNPKGGKVIKETLREYHNNSQTLIMEERYRVRPFHGEKKNEDLSHTLTFYTPDHATWITFLQNAGFSTDNAYGDYDMTTFTPGNDTLLLLKARAV